MLGPTVVRYGVQIHGPVLRTSAEALPITIWGGCLQQDGNLRYQHFLEFYREFSMPVGTFTNGQDPSNPQSLASTDVFSKLIMTSHKISYINVANHPWNGILPF